MLRKEERGRRKKEGSDEEEKPEHTKILFHSSLPSSFFLPLPLLLPSLIPSSSSLHFNFVFIVLHYLFFPFP